MTQRIVLLSLLISLFSANTFAGILIDPYVGFGNSTTTLDQASGSYSDDSTDSVSAVGGRLGYSFLLLSAGIDYQMATIDDAKRTNTSAFVGFDLPILLRVWAEYTLSSQIDDDDLDSNIDISLDSGYSVGIGFTGLPFVSINLEVEQHNYTYENVPTLGELEVASATYLLSVSLPLDF
jgi:hypothetical protein